MATHLTSREFQKIARQRLEAAELLFANGYCVDSGYLAGYTVECSLKSLILHLTTTSDQLSMFERISTSAAMHRAEVLTGLLRRNFDCLLPIRLTRRLQRFDWSTEFRYRYGRANVGETRGLLKTAKEVHDWVEGELS